LEIGNWNSHKIGEKKKKKETHWEGAFWFNILQLEYLWMQKERA
jgi:hypothetical protein